LRTSVTVAMSESRDSERRQERGEFARAFLEAARYSDYEIVAENAPDFGLLHDEKKKR